MLSEPSSAFVRGHQDGRRLPIIVLNDKPEAQFVTVRSKLDLWLPSVERYRIKYFNSDGRLACSGRGGGATWHGTTSRLQPLELALFEVEAE